MVRTIFFYFFQLINSNLPYQSINKDNIQGLLFNQLIGHKEKNSMINMFKNKMNKKKLNENEICIKLN